ncbi:hypothetical protein CcaCcLH18_13319 [Colletotrichum camelliae]|nr:hypothetical protein CcaCcLH18_13319 [Colletotrichum camelliae]
MAFQYLSLECEGPCTEPEPSPYAGPVCKICCDSGESLTVHRDLLRESAGLDKLCGQGKEFRLTDVPYEAVHAIVHFLYTRQWQTIRWKEVGKRSAACARYEISVHEKLLEYAADLRASNIIMLTANASCLLDDDDAWLSSFTEPHLKRFLEGSTFPIRVGFLGYFANTTPY